MWVGKLLGAVFVIAAGSFLGMHRAREYSRRVTEIEDMLRCLLRMQTEIAQRLTPMPALFTLLAAEKHVCRAFFTALANGMQTKSIDSLAVLWQACAENCLPSSPAREVFAALGSSLGCYDADAECAAIEGARCELQELLAQARATSARDGTLWRKLGVAGGVAAAIFLY